jgi:signal recognition particle subunit SRP19
MPGGDFVTEAIIWLAYIDAEKSRAEGRKIPAKKALASPSLKEIEAAAKKLGLNPKTEKEKAYPKAWWEKTGLIKVDKKKSKILILAEIAKEIKSNRA